MVQQKEIDRIQVEERLEGKKVGKAEKNASGKSEAGTKASQAEDKPIAKDETDVQAAEPAGPVADQGASDEEGQEATEESEILSVLQRLEDGPDEGFAQLFSDAANEDIAGAEVVPANLPAAKTGSSSPGTRPTVKQMVDKINGLIVTYVGMGLGAIGAYLLMYVFDGNHKKALSKDPYKGTSLNDLARHKDMPLSRQRLAECVRAAALDKELAASGLNSDILSFHHKVEISKVRSQEARAKLAQKAVADGLTVREVRDRVKQLTGRSSSEDKRLAHTLIKQMRRLAGVTVDEDTREFLADKNRLKAALSTGEAASLLEHSERFRDSIMESGQVLQRFEKTLVQLVIEARQEDDAEAKPEADETTSG
jgi:hypothetical protein